MPFFQNKRHYRKFDTYIHVKDPVIELGQRLKQLKSQGKWNPDTMAEFEDSDGSVLDKATYELLAKQFES